MWVVEHSNKQNCYHIDNLERVLEININNLRNNGESDYQIICLGTYEECEKFVNKIKISLQNKEKVL